MGFGDFLSSAGGGNIIGSAIGAVGSLLGGSGPDYGALAAQQYANQKEFAQNGVRWKVADAQAAGIHPLAALGAQTFSYSPVMAGDAADNRVGDALRQMGQGISRAAEAKQLADERALNAQLVQANIRKVNAETDYVQQQAKNAAQSVANTALPPPMPNVKSSNTRAGGYDGNVRPLLTLARVGRTLLDVINPDFADSITESQYRNMIANVSPEWNVSKGYLKAPIEYLEPDERELVRSGKYELVRFPGGWHYKEKRMSPAEKYRQRHGSDAWHDPSNWKWLDKFGQFIKDLF